MFALLSILVFANTSITRLVSDTSKPYCLKTDEAISALSAIDIFVAAAKSKVHGNAFIISFVLKPACQSIVIPSAASLAVNFVFAPSSIARSFNCLNCVCTSFVSQKSQSVAFAVLICFSKSAKVSTTDHTPVLSVSRIHKPAIAEERSEKFLEIHFVDVSVVFESNSIDFCILCISAVALSCASNISFIL